MPTTIDGATSNIQSDHDPFVRADDVQDDAAHPVRDLVNEFIEEEKLEKLANIERLKIRARSKGKVLAEQEESTQPLALTRSTDGADFIFGASETARPVWGRDEDILWSEGESLIICGTDGTGKTTLAGQLLKARLNLGDGIVLGFPVRAGARRILYLACDRPKQAARSLARQFGREDTEVLQERLTVWKGPPPFDFAKRTDTLLRMCEAYDADTVIIDSLKDVALGISDDETGTAYNRARQLAIANGIEVIELHHTKKQSSNGGGRSHSLEMLYGSRWLAAGAGSVIMLDGEPGDPVVKLRHLKQPMNEVGPLDIEHEAKSGTSSVFESGANLEDLLYTPGGLTALMAAEREFQSKKPTLAERQRMRRKLDRLVTQGIATKVAATTKGNPDVYLPARARPDHASA
ncbi:AAA family ATPase [Streptomyces sp. AcH 505]|uniref:AAA family ATPase n=1 Tax=Streptomyces sp. AcH 505 TaxID=352211 RepID=UPI0012FEEA63